MNQPRFIQVTVTPEDNDYHTTIFALDENGDVWFINPFMPNKEDQKWEKVTSERKNV